MPGMKRRSRSGSVRTRSSGVAPGGSGSSDPIDLEALASEEKGDEGDYLAGEGIKCINKF